MACLILTHIWTFMGSRCHFLRWLVTRKLKIWLGRVFRRKLGVFFYFNAIKITFTPKHLPLKVLIFILFCKRIAFIIPFHFIPVFHSVFKTGTHAMIIMNISRCVYKIHVHTFVDTKPNCYIKICFGIIFHVLAFVFFRLFVAAL